MIGVVNYFTICCKMCLTKCAVLLIGFLIFCAEIGKCVYLFHNLGIKNAIQIAFLCPQEQNWNKQDTENNGRPTITCKVFFSKDYGLVS